MQKIILSVLALSLFCSAAESSQATEFRFLIKEIFTEYKYNKVTDKKNYKRIKIPPINRNLVYDLYYKRYTDNTVNYIRISYDMREEESNSGEYFIDTLLTSDNSPQDIIKRAVKTDENSIREAIRNMLESKVSAKP